MTQDKPSLKEMTSEAALAQAGKILGATDSKDSLNTEPLEVLHGTPLLSNKERERILYLVESVWRRRSRDAGSGRTSEYVEHTLGRIARFSATHPEGEVSSGFNIFADSYRKQVSKN